MSVPDGIDVSLQVFTERSAALGVRVERVAGPAGVGAIVADEAASAGTARLVVSSEVRRRAPVLSEAIPATIAVETSAGPAAVRDAPLALTLAHAAYAETGSVLLAEPDLADRAVGMLSGTLLVVVGTGDLVAGLDEMASQLRALASRPGGGYATVMTGPSRTADIERVLTVGVQGPGRIVVVFVDRLA